MFLRLCTVICDSQQVLRGLRVSFASCLISEFLCFRFFFFFRVVVLISWVDFFCCVLVPGTLALGLPRTLIISLPWFFSVSVCDHIICTSYLYRMKNHEVLLHFDKLRTTHHQVLLGVIGFQRRQRIDHTTLSYAKALKKTRRESTETTIHKRMLFFAGGVARQTKGRSPSRVMFGTMTGGEGPRSGGQSKTWHKCPFIVDDLKSVSSHRGVHRTLPVDVRS